MAPISFRAKNKGDEKHGTTHSQSIESNMKDEYGGATVGTILQRKGNAVFSVHPDDTVKHATQVLKQHRIGALLVKEINGDLIGIISERDIVRQLADTPGGTLAHQVKDVMTANPQLCYPSEKLMDIMQRMTEGRFRHLPVVDDGAITGLVTIGDVVKFRLMELEYEALRMKQMIVG